MTKKQNWVTIGIFLTMIFGFTAGSLLKPDKEFSEKENRVLQQLPELNLNDFVSGKFATNYETYLSDQFFARDGWIALKTGVDRSLGKQEANGVYFAKDGYLIETHTGEFKSASAEQNIKTVAQFIENWKEEYTSRHLKVCIVPNAVDILEDKLPAFVENQEEQEYLEQIKSIIPEEYLVDAQEILREHKDEAIYYHTDHHWTTLASRYVYKKWAEEIGLYILPDEEYEVITLTEGFYGTVDAKVNTNVQADTIKAYLPLDPVSYTLTYNHGEEKDSLYDESYLEGRDKYAVFFGGNQPIIQADTGVITGRKLLILKDSYANCFLSFAMQDFGSIDIVDLRYFNENLNDYLLEGDYTDVLLLYNASGFASDTSISKLALASGKEE